MPGIGKDYLQSSYYNTNVAASAANRTIKKNINSHEALKIAESLQEKVHTGNGAIPEKGKGAPYSYLADKNGVIEYNGVTFICDNEKRELCLGDMSNSNDVIRIPLSGGGTLKINRNNIDQLSKAIGMFSPEDINIILRALKLDAKIQQMKKEIEDMEDGVGKSSEEQNADSAQKAQEAKENNDKVDGLNGYETKSIYSFRKI
ncbi:MAG: hypothetical protein GX235_11775 [Clostridiales bacterium]|nr:hypothetical protein [Clostridiales bacterium]